MTAQKLMNADFKFVIEKTSKNTYICSQLSDRSIVITLAKPKTLLYSTDSSGNKTPIFNNDEYTYTTTFHQSGFTFSYSLTNSRVFGSYFGNIVGTSAPTEIERIQNHFSNCYLHFVNEDYCKSALQFFNETDCIVFGRKQTDGLVHFTLDAKRFDSQTYHHYIHKSYLYDEAMDTLYHDVGIHQHKFSELFHGIVFTESAFYLYQSLNHDAFNLNVYHAEEKKYIKLQYANEQLIINNLINNTTMCIKGDETIGEWFEQFIKNLIVFTPTQQLQRYVNEFDLDLTTLSTAEIKTLVMADY